MLKHNMCFAHSRGLGTVILWVLLFTLAIGLQAAADSESFTRTVQPGGQRNDADCWAGMSVTVGDNDVEVTHLGRFVLAGNTEPHAVKIVRAWDQTDVARATVVVETESAVVGEFAYAPLNSPIRLMAHGTYYFVSQEQKNGDRWHDVDTTLSVEEVASVNSGIFRGAGFSWSIWGGPNSGFGPVDFKFNAIPTQELMHVAVSSIEGDLRAPAQLLLNVESDPLVTRVELFQGGILIQQSENPPFTFVLTNLPAGIYPWRLRGVSATEVDGLSAPFSIEVAAREFSERAFVTGFQEGRARHDYSGELGMQFTVGSQPLTLTALGRLYIAGNAGWHRLRLVRAYDQVEVAHGATLLSMAGGTPGQFKYAPLSVPLTLTPGTSYYLLSEELANGDDWLDFDGTILSSDVATLDGPVFVGDGWIEVPAPGRAFVPLNFKHLGPAVSAPPAPAIAGGSFITNVILGAERHDFNGFVGMTVRIGPDPIQVNALGRYRSAGNLGVHQLKIVRASDGTDVPNGSATVNLAEGVDGTFSYGSLLAPVTLAANTDYHIVSEETFGGDTWRDLTTRVLNVGVGSVRAAVYGQGGNWQEAAGQGITYGPVDFRYGDPADDDAPRVLLVAPLPGTVFTAPSQLTLGAQVSSGVVNLEYFAGAVFLGQVEGPPWELTWVNPPVGTHDLTARATDGNASVAISAVIQITIDQEPLAQSGEEGLVRTVTGGIARRDFDGFVGFRFTTGPQSIEVTGLGRYVLPGNKGRHELKLIRASDRLDVPGGDVAIETAGAAPGTFRYDAFQEPIPLQPYTSYYLVSEESSSGDEWLDLNVQFATTDAAIVAGAVYSGFNPAWNEIPGPAMFGPLSFRYRVQHSTLSSLQWALPMEGAIHVSPAVLPLEVAASAEVVRVEFLSGSETLGEAMTRPFAWTWPNPQPGDYTLIARAIDIQGRVVVSDSRHVSILAGAPGEDSLSVALSQPSQGQHFTAPATVVLQAIATRGVVRVDFFQEAAKIGESTGFPFLFRWSSPPVGPLALSARAYTATGTQAASMPIHIVVEAPPVESEEAFITSVNPGDARHDVNGFLGMEFTVGPAPITVTKLGRLKLPGNIAGHRIKLVTAPDGGDVAGGAVTVLMSEGLEGEFIYGDLLMPITLPAYTSYFLASEEVLGGDDWYDVTRTKVTAASAASVDGGVFTLGGWVKGGSPGHIYTPVNFTFAVARSPAPPTIVIMSPLQGGVVMSSGTIEIEASTSPEVAKVEFFEGVDKLGEDLSQPFTLTWNNVPAGEHRVLARATSNHGLTAMSQLVAFSVLADTSHPGDDDEVGLRIVWAEGELRLMLHGSAQATYRVEQTSDFVHWTLVDVITLDSAEQIVRSLVPHPGALFYRVSAN